MELIVWNSQGGKWDTLWSNYILPRIIGSTDDDVSAYVVESGWAPWVSSGDVSINTRYSFDSRATYFDKSSLATSNFCHGVNVKRGRRAIWVPWVKNLDAMKTNTRCSMGIFSRSGPGLVHVFGVKKGRVFQRRPLARNVISKGKITLLTVILVHLISGSPSKAQEDMLDIIKAMSKVIPEGSAALIIGDMNIDLLVTPVEVPKYWRILNTGVATQQSGGELDYGILYDPQSQFTKATASVVEKFKTGNNGSDHSVMLYTLPL